MFDVKYNLIEKSAESPWRRLWLFPTSDTSLTLPLVLTGSTSYLGRTLRPEIPRGGGYPFGVLTLAIDSSVNVNTANDIVRWEGSENGEHWGGWRAAPGDVAPLNLLTPFSGSQTIRICQHVPLFPLCRATLAGLVGTTFTIRQAFLSF